MNHCDVHPSLGGLGKSLEVFTEPSAAAQPSECSFNDPSFRQHLKLMAIPRTFDDLQNPPGHPLDPLNELSRIASIGPYQGELGKPPQQFAQDQLGPIPVLNMSGVDYDGQQQSQTVHHDMPLAPLHLLPRVITARPPFSVVFTD
jgi:hypothetical protein